MVLEAGFGIAGGILNRKFTLGAPVDRHGQGSGVAAGGVGGDQGHLIGARSVEIDHRVRQGRSSRRSSREKPLESGGVGARFVGHLGGQRGATGQDIGREAGNGWSDDFNISGHYILPALARSGEGNRIISIG